MLFLYKFDLKSISIIIIEIMKYLLIVESPAKAKKIQSFSKDYTVIASFGHVVDLPKDNISIDIENDFKPNYKILPDKRKHLKKIKEASKGREIFLAADDDREGDAIAWHCGNYLKMDYNKNNRITFCEISKAAIERAIENKHKLDMNSVNAQQARRIIDRLVGYKLSPLLWKNIDTDQRGLSAGRVQSTLLMILKEHEKHIENYKKSYESKLIGDFNIDKNYIIKCDYHFTNKPTDKILTQFKKERIFNTSHLKDKIEKKYPPPPLITSSLQQDAQKSFGFNVSYTMKIAQKLYENGKITYMRTDSTIISKDFKKILNHYISENYGKEYYNNPLCKKVKGAQEAHECIRVTSLNEELSDKYSEQEKKLYKLIKDRTIISHMKASEYNVSEMRLLNDITRKYGYFVYFHKECIFDGYQKYYGKDINKNIINNFKTISECMLKEAIYKEVQNNPPQYYNESSIVKKLESSGIGRPSTYASIVNILSNRNYTECITIPSIDKEDKYIKLDKNNNIQKGTEISKTSIQKSRIKLTELGNKVYDYLYKHFSDMIHPEFTARVEKDLDLISLGKLNWISMIRMVYDAFHPIIEKLSVVKSIKKTHNKSKEIGFYKDKSVLLNNGPYGKYITYDNKNISLKYYKGDISINPELIQLIEYPKKIGTHQSKDMIIKVGPYGKYMKYNNKNIKIPQKDNYTYQECLGYL